jgi:hypothetical protein
MNIPTGEDVVVWRFMTIMTILGSLPVLTFTLLQHRERLAQSTIVWSFRVRVKQYRTRAYSISRLQLLLGMTEIFWLLVMVLSSILVLRLSETENLRQGGSPDRFFVPPTEYSITELDQAVVLSAGVLTLICTIYEAYVSRQLSAWERYQEWRADCEGLLKEGLVDEEEALKWEGELQAMARQEEEMLSTPTRTVILATMEQTKKERKDQKLILALKEVGFI